MAFEAVWSETYNTEADLSAKQHYVATRGTAVKSCVLAVAASEPLGVINEPAISGQPAGIIRFGTAHAIAGAAIAAHANLGIDSAGRVVTATTASAWIIGKAQEAATAAGDIIEIQVWPRPYDLDLTSLASVADGTAGADLVGLTPLALTGAANTVQEFAEALAAVLASTTDSSSGADAVAITTIAGITAVTVQAALEAIKTQIGDLSTLETTAKTSLVAALNEVVT